MHELHLAEDVLNKVKAEARAKGLDKVTQVKVLIGQSLVSDQAELQELLEMLSAGSIAEGAKFEIEISPIKAVCGDCKKEFNSQVLRLDCSYCGSTNIQISSGRELVISVV